MQHVTTLAGHAQTDPGTATVVGVLFVVGVLVVGWVILKALFGRKK